MEEIRYLIFIVRVGSETLLPMKLLLNAVVSYVSLPKVEINL